MPRRKNQRWIKIEVLHKVVKLSEENQTKVNFLPIIDTGLKTR